MVVLHHHHCRRVALTVFLLLFFVSTSARTTTTNTTGGELVERVLNRLGSSPPSCRSKCGRCWPCRAVRVAIQPGRSVPLEYYPEAWRCKCGNKLFMP
ncbi:hypothetical protein GIB67_018279 [Kingdonia uniflora]|uniref:Epidermal patterning factor-like protein n=1 Tax=Kingdonia uniflora TaxID=39325 RepID=A0A7J7LF60_9MAGN|nr:hypothetical protein GIB67_018279 [Kingdonia uniflora]